MADEPDDIEPDLLRDRLLMQAERGEITGEQAEEAAATHGLEPFERKPESSLRSKAQISLVDCDGGGVDCAARFRDGQGARL